MAICCPQGRGTLPPSHIVVPKLSQSCVGNIPLLSQSCPKVVYKLSQSCPKVVPKLPQSFRKDVSKLCRSSRDGYCHCIVNMNEPKCKTVTAINDNCLCSIKNTQAYFAGYSTEPKTTISIKEVRTFVSGPVSTQKVRK